MMFGRYYFAQKMGDEGGEGHEQPLFVFEASKVGFEALKMKNCECQPK